ncbi:MAG: S1 family peptidase [Gemmataceae bacterium]|nr:S1 family peptidase [Gemmataceae bacterium]
MGEARVVAQQLAAEFLARGSYTFANPMSAGALGHVMPAADSRKGLADFFDESGFEGLAVQSIGYEEGAAEPKVHIYVTKGSVRGFKSLPDDKDGVKIQVNKMGKLMVRPEQASSTTNQGNVFVRKERVACGSSCAPSGENLSGTFGALVRKKGNKNALFVLSNNHVLAACNHVPVGMPILSPSSLDARPGTRAPGEIARHEQICELRSGEPTLVAPCREDVAIARVTNPANVTSWQGDAEDGYDTPQKLVSPAAGMAVKKFGRTTGFSQGIVEALVNTPTAIPYKARYFAATVWVQDVWTVRAEAGTAFALPGDSGSLVVTEDGSAAVGLVFAAGAGGQYGWIIPAVHLGALFGGLTFVQGHGI